MRHFFVMHRCITQHVSSRRWAELWEKSECITKIHEALQKRLVPREPENWYPETTTYFLRASRLKGMKKRCFLKKKREFKPHTPDERKNDTLSGSIQTSLLYAISNFIVYIFVYKTIINQTYKLSIWVKVKLLTFLKGEIAVVSFLYREMRDKVS